MPEQQPEQLSFNKLQHFPGTIFATVMGITGLAIAFLRYEAMMKFSWGVGQALLYLVTAWWSCWYLFKPSWQSGDMKSVFLNKICLKLFIIGSILFFNSGGWNLQTIIKKTTTHNQCGGIHVCRTIILLQSIQTFEVLSDQRIEVTTYEHKICP